MPRVKIDYIVSFSSEDPEHPASNLLNREVSKKKWLCVKGEPSCSVVLQLAKAVKISGVHIGAHHAAMVEVLVARSETCNDQYEVLVCRSVLSSREESRRGLAAERVRSFGAQQLRQPAAAQRWDRVRVVCHQPYDKHCKYGLSFVHIDEAESAAVAAPAPPPPPLQLTFDASSDEDEFKPGELFAKHLKKNSTETTTNNTLNTSAQIRQATSQALKNISESSIKLTKATVNKPSNKRDSTTSASRPADTEPSPAPRRDRTRASSRDSTPATKRNHTTASCSRDNQSNSLSPRTDKPQKTNDEEQQTFDDHSTDNGRKRRRSSSEENCPGEESAEPHTLLQDAVLVFSGYQNPLRAELRNLALSMGARVRQDWGPGCTHLICAFPNTPKLRAMRAASPGAAAARGDWLRQCAARRRRLPWRWFATEPQRLLPEPAPAPASARGTRLESDPEGDTDDEIEKVLQKQKKRRVADVKSVDETNEASQPEEGGGEKGEEAGRGEEDVSTDMEEGEEAGREEEDVSTDEEEGAARAPRLGGALAAPLRGRSFTLRAASPLRGRLTRALLAYGGLVLDEATLDADSPVDYVVVGAAGLAGPGPGLAGPGPGLAGPGPGPGRGRQVSPAWLSRCIRAGRLLPHDA